VLARLDEELAPSRAAVDRGGNLLRIEGVNPQDRASVASAVISRVSEMGDRGEILDDQPMGIERWYSQDEVEELSMEEARILAGRLLAEIGEVEDPRWKDMDPSAARGFLQETLLNGFRKAAETGEIDLRSFRPPEAFEELTPEQQRSLVDWLRSRAEGRGGHGWS
jgi:hypothetical protein